MNTPSGNIPIENIKLGQMVWSYNVTTNKLEPKKVIGIQSRQNQPICRVKFESGKEIKSTPDHKFYVSQKKGFVDISGWNLGEVGESLKFDHKGDPLLQSTKFQGASYSGEKADVINLSIDGLGTSNYFVNGILVHNEKGRGGD